MLSWGVRVGILSEIGVASELDLLKRFNRSNGHRGYTHNSKVPRTLFRDCSITSRLIIEGESVHWGQFAGRFVRRERVRDGHNGITVSAHLPGRCRKPRRECSLIR